MKLLVRKQKIIPRVSTIWDHVDVFVNQSICFKALYFLRILTCTYATMIDISVGDPGHRKDVVDSMNAHDKGV